MNKLRATFEHCVGKCTRFWTQAHHKHFTHIVEFIQAQRNEYDFGILWVRISETLTHHAKPMLRFVFRLFFIVSIRFVDTKSINFSESDEQKKTMVSSYTFHSIFTVANDEWFIHCSFLKQLSWNWETDFPHFRWFNLCLCVFFSCTVEKRSIIH